MCTFNIALDDTVVSQMQSSFPNNEAIGQWIQQQIELLANQFVANSRQISEAKVAEIDSEILQMFGGKQIVPTQLDEKTFIRDIRENRYL